MKDYFALTFGLLCAALLATQAQAQRSNCAPRELVLQKLGATYGESRRMIAMAANNTMVEVFGSEETGTWTITVTQPNGITCVAAAGQAFEMVDEQLPAALGDPA